MSPAPGTLQQHRQVLAAAHEALSVFSQALFQAGGTDLGELLREVDALASVAGGVRAEIVLEAKRRGEISQAGKNTHEWVIEHAPSQRQGGAGQLAGLIDKVHARTAGRAGLSHDVIIDPDSPIALIWERTRTGEATPATALSALSEIDKLTSRLRPHLVPTVTTALLDLGVSCGRPSMGEIRMRFLARYGDPDAVDDAQKRLTPHAYLSAPSVASGDLTTYKMGLTPEQAAILEAVLGPLAAPQPNETTGERDLRSRGQRRVEALIEICSRASCADAAGKSGPEESNACVYVTVDLDSLRKHTGAGEVLGSGATATLLSPQSVRKMCCDAAIIPTVLGADGEQLDLGRVERFFTRPQRRAVWRRDKTCTYPGCSAPGAWTKVHHVHHWLDGGTSDINNAALLCQRHHTTVHNKRLWAQVRDKPDDTGTYVHWDLTPGSYDRELNGTNTSPWTVA
ncbi:MAG: DUF222 domain-containing protein [Dermatophilaceae bacterium]